MTTDNIQLVIKTLSTLTVIGDVILVLLILLFIFNKIKKTSQIEKLFNFLGKESIFLAFIVALIATSGSLFFSEVAKYVPCKLCWFQRICMYPQVLLLGVALFFKDKNIRRYVIPLSIIGAVFSVYNYYIQLFPPVVNFCSINNADSCSQKIILHYGYITFATMALTASLMIIFFNYFSYWKDKNNR
jgi:hypothetical protein